MGKAGIVHKGYVEDLLLNIGKRTVETKAFLEDNRIIDRNKMSLLLFLLELNLLRRLELITLPEAYVFSLSSLYSL